MRDRRDSVPLLCIVLGILTLSVQAQEIYTGAIEITPAKPTDSWQANNPLAPGDSAKLRINVAASGAANGKNYKLTDGPTPTIAGNPDSMIWTGNGPSFNAINAGDKPGQTTVTVTATWTETGGGGTNGGGSPSTIDGEGTGIAEADTPVFTWKFDPRVQFADGKSPISFSVSGAIGGRPVSMSAYTVKATDCSVMPDDSTSTTILTGKLTSSNAFKGTLSIDYGQKEQGESDDEIAFGKVDLIVPQGPGTNGGTSLIEDRQTDGGTAPTPNELDPGTIVLLFSQDQTNRVSTKLTLNADPTGGSLTLEQHGLTDLKIYTDKALLQELPIPKTWEDGDPPPTSLYMVGISSSTNLQSAQGTLDLTYKTTLAANGMEHSIKDTVGVNLLPIEIVDKDKKAVTKLKVGKMAETGVLSGAEGSATLDINKDSDRFYVRIPGAASMGTVSIKVATVENSDASYNDDESEIDMQVEGNDLITKSMLLVSDDVDDDYQVDGVVDDAKNDRTHKVQLGGKFQVKSIKIGGTEHQADIKTPVPVKKTVNFGVVVLRQTAGGAPVVTQADVENDLKIARERYAQVGTQLTWSISIHDPPAGVDLSDGLLVATDGVATMKKVAPETRALIEAMGTANTNADIHLFYVNELKAFGSIPRGVAIADYWFDASEDSYLYNCFVAASRGPFTAAHELAHLLTDEDHHSSSYNLLRNGTSTSNTLGGSKRIETTQESKIQANAHAQ
jgi:hypothetical protein